MPRLQTRKTELTYRTAKPTHKDYLISDGDGLALKVMPSGSKKWVSRFRHDGTQHYRTIGHYSTMSLREARERNFQIRYHGEVDSRANREASTLDDLLKGYVADNPRACSKSTLSATSALLKRHIPSVLLNQSIQTLRLQDIYYCAKVLCEIGRAETGHRLFRQTRMIIEHAYRIGKIESHPICSSKGGLPPVRAKNRAAILDLEQFRALTGLLWKAPEDNIAINAIKIMALVFARPSEVICAQWSEIDFSAGLWVIPESRMKMRRPHGIPLTKEVTRILLHLKDMSLSGTHVFPSPVRRDKPISHSMVLRTLRNLGYGKEHMCLHGFRASAATLCIQVLRADPTIVQAQLSHHVNKPVFDRYNRYDYFEQRQILLGRWEELILSQAIRHSDLSV